MNRSASASYRVINRARNRDFSRDPGSSTDRASRAGVASTRDARGRRRRVIPSIRASTHPSIHPSIHPSETRARVRPRAVGAARVRPRADRDDATARETTESIARGDSIRPRVVDRSRTIDRSTVDSIRFRDGRRDIDARDDLGEARRKRGRPSRTARADANADARSARARCRTRTCRAGGRWRCAREGRRSERCRARSRE